MHGQLTTCNDRTNYFLSKSLFAFKCGHGMQSELDIQLCNGWVTEISGTQTNKKTICIFGKIL